MPAKRAMTMFAGLVIIIISIISALPMLVSSNPYGILYSIGGALVGYGIYKYAKNQKRGDSRSE